MTRKLPDVLDEPDDRKRVWAAIEKEINFSVFYVDRQHIWNAIAHELAEQIRAAWNAHDPKKPGNVTMLSALNAADHIDPEVQP